MAGLFQDFFRSFFRHDQPFKAVFVPFSGRSLNLELYLASNGYLNSFFWGIF